MFEWSLTSHSTQSRLFRRWSSQQITLLILINKIVQEKNNLVQLKKQTTQNTAKQNYPGSVASYYIRPGNEVGLFYTTLPIPRDTGQYKEEIKEPQTAIQHEILSCTRPRCVTLYKACSIPSPTSLSTIVWPSVVKRHYLTQSTTYIGISYN